MADYWKSQPRKFCELCKCWLADNKPSRDFHERGKRHQESVKRKLDELKKKGVQDAKKERENNKYLMQMERGAMKKFEQDLQTDPLLAAKYAEKLKQIAKEEEEQEQEKSQITQFIMDKLKTKNLPIPPQMEEMNEQLLIEQLKKQQETAASSSVDITDISSEDWQEAFSEEGHVYYWNVKTQESSWYLPGSHEYQIYLQHISMLRNTSSSSTSSANRNDDDDDDDTSEADEATASSTSSATTTNNEKTSTTTTTKHFKSKTPTTTSAIKITIGNPLPTYKNSSSVYGTWKEVKSDGSSSEPLVDLQLPTNKCTEYKTVIVPNLAKEPKLTIRERTLPININLNKNSQPVAFKKRKINRVKVKNEEEEEEEDGGDGDGVVAKIRSIRRTRDEDE